MEKLKEDSNGLQLWFVKTCQTNRYSKFIYVVYDCCENELISMSRAWNKEKSESLTGFEPMTSQ